MRKRIGGVLVAMVWAGTLALGAQAKDDGGVFGFWREPQGSVIHIDRCGENVCLTLAQISRTAPARVDGLNPDPKLKGRPLCGVQIGTGFHLEHPNKAEGGRLYDPKSGKTYQGAISSIGNTLVLRGYVGIKAFGRSEEWTRISPLTQACS